MVGELTPLESSACDEVLFSGLGTGLGKIKSGDRSLPSASAGSVQDLSRVEKDNIIPKPLDLSLPPDNKVSAKVLNCGIPIDLSASSMQADSVIANKKPTISMDTPADIDALLKPSPPPKEIKTHCLISSQAVVQVKNLDMKGKLSVHITPDMIGLLPKLKSEGVKDIKEEAMEPQVMDDKASQSSDETVLYAWTDEPTLLVLDIPEWYKKPKFHVPKSLTKAKFRVKVHGIKCRKTTILV